MLDLLKIYFPQGTDQYGERKRTKEVKNSMRNIK